MPLRNALLQVSARVRQLAGPERMDQRPHRVSILTRTWSGGFRQAGEAQESSLTLPQDYVVRQLSTREVAGSGGRFEMGDVFVDGITPEYVTRDGERRGFSPSALNPTVTTNGVETIYRLTGPHEGDYRLVELQSWRTYSYALVLRRRSDSP